MNDSAQTFCRLEAESDAGISKVGRCLGDEFCFSVYFICSSALASQTDVCYCSQEGSLHWDWHAVDMD